MVTDLRQNGTGISVRGMRRPERLATIIGLGPMVEDATPWSVGDRPAVADHQRSRSAEAAATGKIVEANEETWQIGIE